MLDNPFVTHGLAYFIQLAPPEFIKTQAMGNLKKVLTEIVQRVASLTPPSPSFISKLLNKKAPLPDPTDLLGALEALSEVIDAIADANIAVFSNDEKLGTLQLLDNLADHPDFRVKTKSPYIRQALLRVPGQEPREYLLLCQLGRTILLIDQVALGVQGLDLKQVLQALNQIPTIFQAVQQINGEIGDMSATKEKGQSWYSRFRACEYFIHSQKLNQFEELLNKSKSFDTAFAGCLLMLYRKIAQTHPSEEMRKKSQEYIKDLLDPKWGDDPDLKREVRMTLSALGYSVDPNQPVTLMTLLIPSSHYPTKLFEEVKTSIPHFYLNQIEQYARQEFEKRNYQIIFDKFLPLTVDNGEVLHKKVENYLQDGSKDYFVVRGSHGAGKTIYCRYLEWYLWENYERFQTIPLYLSLQTVKTVDELNEIIEQLFEKNGCSPFLDEAKKNYKVLLIVDHIEALPPKANLRKIATCPLETVESDRDGWFSSKDQFGSDHPPRRGKIRSGENPHRCDSTAR